MHLWSISVCLNEMVIAFPIFFFPALGLTPDNNDGFSPNRATVDKVAPSVIIEALASLNRNAEEIVEGFG